jgi:hypothetical protein
LRTMKLILVLQQRFDVMLALSQTYVPSYDD